MPKTALKREESKQRMIQAAGGAFRTHGLGGIGVDGLAKAADLTSGAFYFHFDSKLDAFNQSLLENLEGLASAISEYQVSHGAKWVMEFARYYLGFKRTCHPRDGCAVPLLSAEVERAGKATQALYGAQLDRVFRVLEAGLKPRVGRSRREDAVFFLSALSGAVSIARAVGDSALATEMAASILKGIEGVRGIDIKKTRRRARLQIPSAKP